MKLISIAIAVCLGPSYLISQPRGDASDMKYSRTTLHAHELKAVSVALSHFERRTDYTQEQLKVENYRMWIETRDGYIYVSFIPVLRPGDERHVGGNLPYARGTTYVIEQKSFTVDRYYGTR